MKMGIRKPSIKKSIKARTTGKLKRKVKKAVNPLYGKKGMGLVNNPQKAVYNKVYSKTTVGVSDLVKGGHSSSGKSKAQKHTSTGATQVKQSSPNATHNNPTTVSVASPVNYSPKTYKICGAILKVLALLIILLSLVLMLALPVVGILFALFGILLFVVGRGYTKKAKSISEIPNEVTDDDDSIASSDSDEEAFNTTTSEDEIK